MNKQITIRQATGRDYEKVAALLQQENLPVEDIDPALSHFFIAEDKTGITGSIGLEPYGQHALLRSMAVHKDFRNQGLATRLVERLLNYAYKQDIKSIYLITNTAELYFEKKGFIKTDRSAVPAVVLQSREFNGLCPASSVIMYRLL